MVKNWVRRISLAESGWLEAQADCLAMPTGEQVRWGASEAPHPVLDLVTFYAQTLGVPERRDLDDPAVLRGKAAFYGAGCASCHVPKFVTSGAAETRRIGSNSSGLIRISAARSWRRIG
jgi:CxxC motif-containing protein (DUF1111 family)